MPPRQRVLRHATVIGSEQISPQLIRLTFDSPDLRDVDLPIAAPTLLLVVVIVARRAFYEARRAGRADTAA